MFRQYLIMVFMLQVWLRAAKLLLLSPQLHLKIHVRLIIE